MAISEKTQTLLNAYALACVQYGAAEPNSRSEAKCEMRKDTARDELLKHLENVELYGVNYEEKLAQLTDTRDD